MASMESYREPGAGAKVHVVSDNEVRISRLVHAPVEKVWQAHTEPEVMRQWLTGGEGRSMTKCEWTGKAGDSYRFGWARPDGSQAFEMGGEIREVDAPHRLVTTERMFGDDGPEQVQVVTLTPRDGGTEVTQVHTFPDRDARDQGLDSRMVEMDSTYAQLDALLA